MLLVRGPSVFGGYMHHEGPGPFVEFDGRDWYRTGDLVVEEPGGVLRSPGRLKRFVKMGGEMISLPAIEAVLAARFEPEPTAGRGPGGEPAKPQGPTLAVESAGPEGQIEIVLFTTQPLEREAVNRVIREAGLSGLHNIRRVVRVEEIPVLGTGKTDYRALRGMLDGKIKVATKAQRHEDNVFAFLLRVLVPLWLSVDLLGLLGQRVVGLWARQEQPAVAA